MFAHFLFFAGKPQPLVPRLPRLQPQRVRRDRKNVEQLQDSLPGQTISCKLKL